MADRYLLESSLVDGYLLEDGSGVLLLEQQAGGDDLATKLVSMDAMLPAIGLPCAIVISGG